ncbi:MAG: hypothetical protein ACTS3F_14240 [Phycisphaerales bacterium]
MPPEVWFAIPSASPERCRAHLPAWRDMGYRIAILQNHERGDIPADITVWADVYPGWAASVNRLARTIVPRSADIVVTGGDDMLPDPTMDAEAIARQFLERFPDTFGVMQPTGDGFMNASEYCGSPWMGRGWLDHAYGGAGPMHDGYRHNWADHELHWVARGLGALWQRPDLSQHHAHFSRHGERPPAYWSRQVAAHDEADVKRFIARRWLGFPGHEPANDVPSPGAAWFASQPAGVAERYWFTRYGTGALVADGAERLAGILRLCAERGYTRIALYGAGTELRAAGAALMDSPVEIGWILDDHPGLTGQRLWNLPITPIESLPVQAPGAPQAIVITSRQHHAAMADRCCAHAAAGVAILGLNDHETDAVRSAA